MLTALLLSTQLATAQTGPPGVPWPPPSPPVSWQAPTRRTLDLARYKRRTSLARAGLGLAVGGPLFFFMGVVRLNYDWYSAAPVLMMLGGFAATAAGVPMLLGGAQGAHNALAEAGLDVRGTYVAAGWASLALTPVVGIGIPLSILGGALQLRENQRALEASQLSVVPQLRRGGAGLAVAWRW